MGRRRERRVRLEVSSVFSFGVGLGEQWGDDAQFPLPHLEFQEEIAVQRAFLGAGSSVVRQSKDLAGHS